MRRDDVIKGNAGRSWFRSERLFSVNGVWYFATREGVDQGPFATRRLAEQALAGFVHDAQSWDEISRQSFEVRELEPDAEEWSHFDLLD